MNRGTVVKGGTITMQANQLPATAGGAPQRAIELFDGEVTQVRPLTHQETSRAT